MTIVLFLMAQVVGTPLPPPVRSAASALLPPSDWAALPTLAVPRRADSPPVPSAFVRDEIASGRCKPTPPSSGGSTLSVDLAVLIGTNGTVRRIVPRAIGCASVEQYATGLALSMVRSVTTAPDSDSWFRTSIEFSW